MSTPGRWGVWCLDESGVWYLVAWVGKRLLIWTGTGMSRRLMGADAIANILAPYLTSLISGLGVVALIVSVVLGVLLFAAGRLPGYITALETRLDRLEEDMEQSQ